MWITCISFQTLQKTLQVDISAIAQGSPIIVATLILERVVGFDIVHRFDISRTANGRINGKPLHEQPSKLE